ncbi:MAG: hypothetical protein ACLQDL_04045 [Spirochaetia bacterium]
MPPQRSFLLYLRSRFHLALALPAAGLVVLSAAFLRGHALAPNIVILAAYVVLAGGLFFTRRGAREVVAKEDEDRQKQIRQKISRYEEIRQGISVLRLGSDEMTRAVELFLQESGSYLEKCRELSLYSPIANERIERVLEICQVYLGERDETATGRRYGLPGTPEAAPVEGLSKEIVECAGVIRQRVTEDLLGTSGKERLHIMKELDK